MSELAALDAPEIEDDKVEDDIREMAPDMCEDELFRTLRRRKTTGTYNKAVCASFVQSRVLAS